MLDPIQHIVVLMMENRSFDHMLGFLYAGTGNTSPRGQPFEGLTGTESNTDASGRKVTVFRITPDMPNAYKMPGANPGEGYANTNAQLFGSSTPPSPPAATCSGFLSNFAATMGAPGHIPLPGTVADDIMGIYPPDMLPVLSGLARGYAVCDQWFASVPSETMPNRCFALAATSDGSVSDPSFNAPIPVYKMNSIFGALTTKGVSWKVYGCTHPPKTRTDFPDTYQADDSHFGELAQFQADVAAGALPAFSFLEPDFGKNGNDQHPINDVSLGEKLMHDVYYALRNGPLAQWNSTLLIITYDEHGGCYDHVPPPGGATPPDDSGPGQKGFDFTRFGVRVPTVLVSPLIPAGTVFRVAPDATPLDHTSILKTVENRWGISPLTARDAAAVDVGAALTLTTPRTDDPLEGAVDDVATHLQKLHAGAVAQLPIPGEPTPSPVPAFSSSAAADRFIDERTRRWIASRRATAGEAAGAARPSKPKRA